MGETPHKKPTVRKAPRTPSSPRPVAQQASRVRVEHPPSATSSQTRAKSTSKKNQMLPTFTAPAVWTKTDTKATSVGGGALATLKHLGLGLLGLIASGIAFVFHALASVLSRSRIALVAFIVVVILGVGGLVDFGMHVGKAYPGVHVGEIDASGKTTEELTSLIAETYGSRLTGRSVTIYANDEAASRIAEAGTEAQDAALAEQLAVEEARANKLAWTADAASLNATVPAEALAHAAVGVGREDGGVFARIGALFTPRTIEPRVVYGEGPLELLATDIGASIGNPRVDYGIAIQEGVAAVTEGHDGDMVNRDTFKSSLDQVFLAQSQEQGSFVAHVEDAPLRIGADAAQATADAVNRALVDGAHFSYEGAAWDASATDIGAWVATRVDERDDGYALVPYIDESQAKPALLSHVEKVGADKPLHVTFEVLDDNVTAHTDGTGVIPLAADAAMQLSSALFGEGGKAFESSTSEGTVNVDIASGAAPTSLSFDEAVEAGIVGSIASFTTEFTTGAGTENRNHNIELVSQLLSNSVVKPGEKWSFNKTAGECNAEKGFLGAGAIIDGEYDDAVGGGICQVATTVFNAIYDSGFPVTTRHNHSLYISSYPTGRDAAVSWPDLDLVWENDAESDVLVRLSCADGSVTATLYGVDPNYQVSSTTGEWSEGVKYQTRTKVDESLAPGTSYVKTRGNDGRSITVIRTVTDESGGVLREDSFSSVYDALPEVVVKGPDAVSDTAG